MLEHAALDDRAALEAVPLDVREACEIEAKYEGYIARQEAEVERLARQEDTVIPAELDYESLSGISNEAREKLSSLRPRTLGAAGRIDGVRPSDIALVGIQVQRLRSDR